MPNVESPVLTHLSVTLFKRLRIYETDLAKKLRYRIRHVTHVFFSFLQDEFYTDANTRAYYK